jgi:hypothetical protein
MTSPSSTFPEIMRRKVDDDKEKRREEKKQKFDEERKEFMKIFESLSMEERGGIIFDLAQKVKKLEKRGCRLRGEHC